MKLSITLAVFLGGCILPTVDTGRDDSCDRQSYLPLLGTNIAAVTLPATPDVRAFSEADLVTQDFIGTRTNLVYDGNGTIIQIFCG